MNPDDFAPYLHPQRGPAEYLSVCIDAIDAEIDALMVRRMELINKLERLPKEE